MKVLVFSDSHRCVAPMINAVRENPDAALIIHAGDMARDVDALHETFPNAKIETVAGNNELHCMLPFDRVFELGGKRIFLTHGHNYGVKSGLSRLERRAAELGADICVFGHTHIRHLSQSGGIYFLNPGALYTGFAVLTIENGNVDIKFTDI